MNIFIDTNVFLSFYHLSNDDLEELKKLIVLIDNKEVTLWLPNQVKDEFYRNRENKIADALKKLKEQQQKRQFPQICKDYPEYTEITALLKQYDKNLSTLIKNVTDDINAKNLKADTVISQLFSKATRIKRTPEIIDKAKTRMSIGNPPGKDDSIGDSINWLLLLDSVPDSEDLYLIADDRDYYSILDENSLKDFLVDEWQRKKDSDIYFYRRLSAFFNKNYPDIKMASELEKDLAIKDLSTSSNFASTHSRIERLSKFSEFSKSQVNELCEIALSNDQVKWIITDTDVKEFYKNLIDTCENLIEKEYFDKINKLFVINEDDEL